jgi:hypothetical protein
VEAGVFVILIMPGRGCPIWEHIPMVGLTARVIHRLIPVMAMLHRQPILMVVMASAEDSVGAEDSASAEDSVGAEDSAGAGDSAEEDGGNSR